MGRFLNNTSGQSKLRRLAYSPVKESSSILVPAPITGAGTGTSYPNEDLILFFVSERHLGLEAHW